jgi:uncharacterized protein (DUF1697 family)
MEMAIFVALLRAINVGSGRGVEMADLARVVGEAGGEQVSTYIQSGNVVFAHETGSPAELEAELEDRMATIASFHVAVIVRTAQEWDLVISECPYDVEDPTKLHVTISKGTLPHAALDAFDQAPYAPASFGWRKREIYLYLPDGIGRAKLPIALGKLDTTASPTTTRNWRTVLELQKNARRLAT